MLLVLPFPSCDPGDVLMDMPYPDKLSLLLHLAGLTRFPPLSLFLESNLCRGESTDSG